MIDNAMKFIVSELNKYVVRQIDAEQDPSIKKFIVLGNVTRAQDDQGNSNDLLGKGIATLVNIEEDRISKSPLNYVRVDDKVEYRNPKIYLNLYCLFSVHHATYDTALQYLSLIIQFFQHRNVINHGNSPSVADPRLDPRIEQLVFDMVSMNFEQVNHLWGTLGGKYLPSVLYKVRLVTIEDGTADWVGTPTMGYAIEESKMNN
jgi:hypothetical protein